MTPYLRAFRKDTMIPLLLSYAMLILPTWCLASPRSIDKSIASVNQDIILQSDVEDFVRKAKSKSFQELFGGIDPKSLNDREAVIQLLIEERIMNQQVKKLELEASPTEIDGQIRNILRRNGISEDQLQSRLKQLGTSMTDYRLGLKRQIERRNLIEREIKPSLEVSEEQLRHFYQRQKTAEGSDKVYKIAHILVSGAGKEKLARAEKIYKEVSKEPEKFEALVKDFSDDSSTIETGGLLGSFSLTQLAKEFRVPVSKSSPGKVIQPIKTAAGYHIIKVLDAVSSDFANLPKEKKDELRSQMVGSELESRMGVWMERKKLESHIKRFDQPKKASN